MTEPTPRQVLYALVAGGFLVVVAVLVVGGALAGLGPTWWSGLTALAVVATAVWSAYNWRRTAVVLILSIALLVVWTVGTLLLVD